MKIIIIIGVIALLLFILWKLKIPKCGNMVLVTGGIKTGKSALSVRMVFKTLRKQRFKVWLYNYVGRYIVFVFRGYWINKKKLDKKKAKPLLYSNVPLNADYVPLTLDMLERKERFVYGSVVYLCESSLVCDSQYFKDGYVNEQLLLFCKLFAHETKGGYLFLDTQSISDNHYAFKRCLSSYFYIHDTVKIPFFLVMHVREMRYSEDSTNAITEDIEDKLKTVIVPKSVWKKYDCYTYSVLTDNLPYTDEEVRPLDDLKSRDIISFKKFQNLYGGIKNEEISKKN